MKFVHIADMHFDCPFKMLSDKGNLGDKRRIEQRQAFRTMIKYIKKEKIPFLFIAGDLYQQEYIRRSTIEFIHQLFEQIPDTKVFITPGNHDPNIKKSYYKDYAWSENVTIFDHSFKKVELEKIDIYGYGFDDFYCTDCKLEELKIDNPEKMNILIMHASLDSSTVEEKQYNSIKTRDLEKKGFDYIALGHIHKASDLVEGQNIIYPGSMISLGFDELGKHGMIVGEIEKGKVILNRVTLDTTEFKQISLDCTNLLSVEELIEEIRNISMKVNELYKLVLTGKRNFEINIYLLYSYGFDERLVKIKDQTKPNYDLNQMANETTLRGIFVSEMKMQLEKEEDEEQKVMIEKAIEIGLDVLE